MLTPKSLAGFTLGMDLLSDETDLPAGTARDAVNVDFNVAGNFSRREGCRRLVDLDGAHCLWGARDRSFGLFAQDAFLRRMILGDGGAPLVATVMSGLVRSTRMTYHEHADQVFFSNGTQIGVVTRTTCRLLGVAEPAAFSSSMVTPAVGRGAIPPGRYGLACSYVHPSGEESALSAVLFVELGAIGGFTLVLPMAAALAAGVSRIRLYLTPTNGEMLYQQAELPVGLASFDLLALTPSKDAETAGILDMQRTLGGSIVRVYNGRLLVARGNSVLFSEPFRYGLFSRRHGFVQFNAEVVMVEPVVGGVFVGTVEAVYFLDGDGPRGFKQAHVGTNVPTPYASGMVEAGSLPAKRVPGLAGVSGPVAVWLGPRGFSVGLPSGQVHDLQADRIVMPVFAAGGLMAVTRNGVKQLLSVVESARLAEQGLALDSHV